MEKKHRVIAAVVLFLASSALSGFFYLAGMYDLTAMVLVTLVFSGLMLLFCHLAVRRADMKTAELSHSLAEAREHIAQVEKFASIGTIAASLTHELNNPLAVILALSEELEGHHTPDERSAYLVGELKPCVMRMKRIIEAFRRRAKGPRASESDEVSSLNQLIDNSIVLMETRLKHNSVVFIRDVPDDLLIKGEPVQMESLLGNLIQNAIDSFDGLGGDAERRISVSAAETPGHGIVIKVSDNGVGIAPENLDRIFNAFFTTKDGGKGTGLGLSLCLRVVKDFGGRLMVVSKIGEGTTFSVSLPAAQVIFNSSGAAA